MTDAKAMDAANAIQLIPRKHLPLLNDTNTFFWQAGRTGQLQFMRCEACEFYVHPPLPICPRCKSRHVTARAVSGRATVASYTINHQVWERGLEAPYIIAIVEIEEQHSLRLTTNIVNCPLENVEIGMTVRVLFDHREDVWLPLFEPDTDS